MRFKRWGSKDRTPEMQYLFIHSIKHSVLLLQGFPHGFPNALQRPDALLDAVQRLVLPRLGRLPVL